MSGATLDQFRAILDHLDADQQTHQLAFFRALHGMGAEAVPELEPRLTRASAPRAFRQLVYEGCFYHAWPASVPMLARALRHEQDPELFGCGLMALGRIGGPEALAALKDLAQVSSGFGNQERVADVLAQVDPAQAWEHHLGLLLEGTANPTAANEAARQLAELVDPTKLSSLRDVLMHPDLLIFRHAVRLVARIQSTEAAEFLVAFLKDCHRDVLEDRALKEILGAFRGVTREAAREQALDRLSGPLAACGAETEERLRTETGPQAIQMVEVLRRNVASAVDGFLIDILRAAVDAKGGRLQSLHSDTLEAVNLRARRLAFAMDAGAEGLAGMVRAQLLPREAVLPVLESGVRLQTGREGLVRALAALAPAGDVDLMDLLTHLPDNALRAAALDVLGERREEALRPALFAAVRDPISDIAQRAMLHLGQLPGAEQVAAELLGGTHLEDIRLGIRFIGLHRLRGLAPDLLALVQNGAREELALEALEALGTSGSTEIAPALLELLHSGQNARIQVGLAQALRDMGQKEVAGALCRKAEELKQPILHVVALEGLVRIQETLGPEGMELILAQVRGAWEGRNPWSTRMRVVLTLPEFRLEERAFWAEVATLAQNALAESRTGGGWSIPEQGKVQIAVRELNRRAGG